MTDTTPAEHLAARDDVWDALRVVSTDRRGHGTPCVPVRVAVNLYLAEMGRPTLPHGEIDRHIRAAGYRRSKRPVPRVYQHLALRPEWAAKAEESRR